MATFTGKTFKKHDDYMTPRYAWADIAHLIPKDKVIWEAFYGDGASGTYLRELGFNTIHEDLDFFTENRGDIIVSNPPFSKSKEVLTRLKELNKPFIMILPASKVATQYARALFKDSEDKLQLIIPRKRIHFQKQINGATPEGWKNACNFDCFYYCWKIGLPRDLLWLD
jgi:Adenine-specific methyltransferase EcoRI